VRTAQAKEEGEEEKLELQKVGAQRAAPDEEKGALGAREFPPLAPT